MKSLELLELLDNLAAFRRNIIRSIDTSKLNLPINKTQERVLMAILKFPDLNMKELSLHAGLEKSSLTRVIDSLIDEGFAARSGDIQDRRIINCSLTRKGLTQAVKIDKLMEEHLDNYLSAFSKSEKDKLISSLSAAVNTISGHI